ncbi:OLC1v1008257C1 [Oldenlandia corymbosa var. corymbosa]|uniref:OLC1v1008257C1 n=1 Tax=Oldenlandia corymbosa var. corymbosa TaxID=529605 RepID=A0AAV1DL43_OLDCO|nr:OLC1v1008257C1 [Oldenlandia corymbosa var. corymbosa]
MMHLALSSWIPFFLLLAVLSLNFVKKWSKKRSSDHEMRNNLPPGPPKLPIIGNMHQLMGSLPHHSLKSLAEKHGDLMHLMLGEIPTIVASSPRAAEAILKTNDTAFADRPGFLAGEILFYGCSDMTFAPYGEYWRQMRKISTLGFLSIRVVRSFSLIRQDEISKLVTSIREESGPEAVNLTQKVSKYTSLMVCRAALGREFGRHQDKMMELLQEVLENTTGFDVSDIFPSWRILPYISRAKPKLVELKNKIDAIFDVIIQEHVENQMEKNGEFGQEDLVDVLLRIQQSGDQKFPVTYANIKAIFMNIFLGGTDTSVVVVEWAMAEMIRNPRVLAKVQSEIRELLPTGTVAIEEGVIQKMSYLKLVIKETLRLHPPLPLLIPRECREQCLVDGYVIRPKTRVMINGWAIGRHPAYWDEPEKFMPERFENSLVDFSGHNYEYLPFGAGRRICPGISFGWANVEVLLANLLYHFDWKLPSHSVDLDMTETYKVTAPRKNNLLLVASMYNQQEK